MGVTSSDQGKARENDGKREGPLLEVDVEVLELKPGADEIVGAKSNED